MPGAAWPSATARRMTAHATACEQSRIRVSAGIDRALRQIRRADQVSQRPGGVEEHGIGHARHASHPQA